MVKYRAVAVAVAVSGGGAVAVAVAVAGLTKRFFNHIQKDFLINVWGQVLFYTFFYFRRPHVERPHLELSRIFSHLHLQALSHRAIHSHRILEPLSQRRKTWKLWSLHKQSKLRLR